MPASLSDAKSFPVEFLNEVSVFETLRVYRGEIFKTSEHLTRLSESCLALGRQLPLASNEIQAWLKEALHESGMKDAMMRISVHWSSQKEGRILVMIWPFKSYPESVYRKGVKLQTSVSKRWSLKAQDAQIKASQYVPGVLAQLDHAGAAENIREHIFLDQDGFLAEGTVSNIFVVTPAKSGAGKKRLLTPGAASGILRGISRELVMALAKKRGFEVLETCLTRHEIYSAEECFMTNTSSEVLPVVEVDRRKIGNGKPGPVSRLLRKDFQKAVRS